MENETPTEQNPVTPETEPQNHPQTPVLETKRRKNKKLLIGIAVIGAILVAGLLYWFLIRKDSPATNDAATASDTPAQQTEGGATSNRIADVYYFYAEKSEGPYTLYKRPASGGERTEITKVDSRPYEVARNGSVYVFSENNNLWLGKYDGQKPKKIASFGASNSVVNGLITKAGELYVSVAPGDSPDKGTLYKFNQEGDGQTAVFSAPSGSALFIEGTDGNQFALRETCWNCDGRTRLNTTKTYSYKANTYTDSSPYDAFSGVEPEYNGYHLEGDYKTIIYFKPTEDKTIATQPTLGYDYEYYVGAPYSLTRLNTETGAEATLLGSLGTKKTQEFDGGKLPAFFPQGFFQQGSESAAYFENIAYLPTAEGVTTLHEFASGERVYFPVYASTEEMVAGSAKFNADGSGNPDVPIYYIDFGSKKVTQIMKATSDTTVFVGVSLK